MLKSSSFDLVLIAYMQSLFMHILLLIIKVIELNNRFSQSLSPETTIMNVLVYDDKCVPKN